MKYRVCFQATEGSEEDRQIRYSQIVWSEEEAQMLCDYLESKYEGLKYWIESEDEWSEVIAEND